MAKLSAHWTESSTADYLYKIGADYVRQIEQKVGEDEGTRAQLATRLGVTKGRVSQVLNHPGNITLRNIVDYARALGLKVAVIAYDDSDPDNFSGPINPEIFVSCWDLLGKPKDFFDLKDICVTADNTGTRMLDPSVVPRKEPTISVTMDADTADNHSGRSVRIVNA